MAIKRSQILKVLVDRCQPNWALISCLGRTSRDLFAFSSGIRDQCFYMLGAMGSVTPLALGVSIGRMDLITIGIEGDGAILMNLGSLVTVKKYGKKNLVLFILNNRQYESTGGQSSQPKDFDLSSVCKSIGLKTLEIHRIEELESFFINDIRSILEPVIIVVETLTEAPSSRITESPIVIRDRFMTKILN